MEQVTETIDNIIHKGKYCPLPVKIIPDNMGINLCSVESVTWTKQEDGQLTDLSIKFIPA